MPTKKNRRIKSLNREINSMIRNLINSKENAFRHGQSNNEDLLGLLLHSSNQNKLMETEDKAEDKGLTVEDVIEECKQFYFAGQETTSSWLTWTMIILAMHPNWQQKAREEVLQVCGRKIPDYEAISQLKIVRVL